MVPCKSCRSLISAKARTCPYCGHPVPQDGGMVLVGVIFAAVAVVMLMLCGGAGSRRDMGMRETPLTPYTQQAVHHELHLAAIPIIDKFRGQLLVAKAQINLFPGHPKYIQAVELVDNMLSELDVMEQRIRARVTTDEELTAFSARLTKFSAIAKSLAASL